MDDVYALLIVRMGDPNLSVDDHYRAAAMLGAADTERVLSFLVAAIQDERLFDPSAMRLGGSAGEGRVKMTVGHKCDEILYGLVAPNAGPGFYVPDWNLWWQQNKEKTIDEIRRLVTKAEIEKTTAEPKH